MEKFMRKKIIVFSVMLALLAGMLSLVLMSSSKLFSPYRFFAFIKMPPVIKNFAVGELIDGKVIEQRLIVTQDALAVAIPKEGFVCAGALMATYFDRRNEGGFLLSVQLPEKILLSKYVSFNKLKDNKFHRVCYDYSFGHLQPGEYIVRLQGVGGKEGSSATVWFTKYAGHPFYSHASVNGEIADGVLTVGFASRCQSDRYPASVFILVALYLVLILFLAYILVVRLMYHQRVH